MERREEENMLELPYFNGLRGGSKIRGAIDVDVAKSAFQKAVRRGNFYLACMMGLRLNEFLEVDQGKGKPIRSNVINRLPVIAGEDIGMGNLGVVKKVHEYVNTYFRGNALNERRLIDLIAAMCLAEKSRLGSHLNAVFYQALYSPEYYPRLEELYPGILNKMKGLEMRMKDLSLDIFDLDGKRLTEQDALLVARIFHLLKHAKDDIEKMTTFFYIRSLYNSTEKYKIKRGKNMRKIASEPIYLIWNKFLEKKNPTIQVLYEQFLEENERHIYLVLALMVYFFEDEVAVSEIDVKELVESHGGYDKILNDAECAVVEIPEYAVDKHTKKGRSKGKDSVVFAIEGAIVENESEWSKKWSLYQRIYIDFRKWCPKFELSTPTAEILSLWSGNSKESIPEQLHVAAVTVAEPVVESLSDSVRNVLVDGFMSKEKRLSLMSDNTLRGQVLTSSYKKYVYIPTDEMFVYKGPFDMKNGTPKEREKIKTLKFRFDVVRYFRSFVLKGEILEDDQKQYWIKYSSLATTEPEDWKFTETFDKTSMKTIKVVDRKSMGILPLAYYAHLKDKIKKSLFGKCKLYCDFLLLYVLGVGDTGLYNVLIGDLAPFIIDIDDDTTKTVFQCNCSIFGRMPATSVVEAIDEGVQENKEKIVNYLKNLEANIVKILELAKEYRVKCDLKSFEVKIEQLVKYFTK